MLARCGRLARSSGMRLLQLVLAWILVAAWACGGDVVVDGRPSTGSGGAGGTSNASAGAASPDAAVNASAGPASVGPGVTSGPAICTCLEACGKLVACGFDLPECDSFCDTVGPEQQETLDCICAQPGCDIDRCQGGGSGSCMACLSELPEGSCSDEVTACLGVPPCIDLVECHLSCSFDPSCAQGCNGQFPGSIDPAYAVLQCAVCESCFEPCADEAAGQLYCTLD
jgi:hypothetical protein